uniref:Uncharacterized protein n=1 Tax=Caenorhabditis japonica TaxID=281687 RepID=A0A8R1ENI3_CAEJA
YIDKYRVQMEMRRTIREMRKMPDDATKNRPSLPI